MEFYNHLSTPCYCICLDKPKPENLKSLHHTFEEVNIQKAVNGKLQVNIDELHPITRISLEHSNDSFLTVPSLGAIGCFLSHRKLWKKCIHLNKPIIVCEEDVYLDKTSQIHIRAALARLPKNADFVSLLYARKPTCEFHDEMFQSIVGPELAGTQMYWINPVAARVFLSDSSLFFAKSTSG